MLSAGRPTRRPGAARDATRAELFTGLPECPGGRAAQPAKYEDALATITGGQSAVGRSLRFRHHDRLYGPAWRTAGVREAIAKYNEIAVPAAMDPLTVQEYNWWWYGDTFTYDDDYRDQLVQGLRKAGVPEGAGAELRLADYKQLISRRGGEYTVKGVTEIDLETAQSMLEAGAILVDVRAATDFERGHIPARQPVVACCAVSDSLGTTVRSDGPVIFPVLASIALFGMAAAKRPVGAQAGLSVRGRLTTCRPRAVRRSWRQRWRAKRGGKIVKLCGARGQSCVNDLGFR
jgi:rhodanese-related sulfurtransferase